MPVWDFEINGEPIQIEADTVEKAAEAAMALQAQMPEAPGAPVTASGLAKAGGAALARGTAYLGGIPGTLGDLLEKGGEAGLSKGYELATGAAPNPYSESGVERFFAGPTPEIRDLRNPLSAPLRGRRPPISARPGQVPPDSAMRRLARALNLEGVEGGMLSGRQLADIMGRWTGGATNRQPENVPEEYVRTIGEFLPSTVAFGGLSLPAILGGGVGPAVTSETAGQIARRFSPERPEWMPDWVPSAETIARVGGVFGSPALVKAGRKTVTPHPTNEVRIKAADKLKKEGVEFTAGQKTGNTTMKYRESEVGGPAVEDLMERQAEQFTSAALKRIGETAPRATPEVMTRAYDRIRNMFDGVSSRNALVPDRQLVSELSAAVRKYRDKTSPSQQAPVVDNMVRDITADMQTGSIAGARYGQYITRLRETGMSGPGDLAVALRDIRKALDEGMERSIRTNNPADLGKWRIARNNYRDLSTIEDVLATGARSEEGLINPTALAQSTLRHGGKRAFVQGKYDLAELAKAGKLILKQLPQSGTSPRLAARLGSLMPNILKGGGVGGAIGTMIGGPVGGAIGTGIGAVGGPAISSIYRRSIMSKPIQDYLGNQLLRREPSLLGEKPMGGLMRILEEEQSAARAKRQKRYSGGHHAD
jgi:hypothetical protein